MHRSRLDTPFKQQRLKAWQPILTPNWVIGTFFLVGLIFIPIGVFLFEENKNVRVEAAWHLVTQHA